MDHSEPPSYSIHVQSMMRAFARADSRDVRQLPGRAHLDRRMPQAVRRALAVLCLWLAAGRAGEMWLSQIEYPN